MKGKTLNIILLSITTICLFIVIGGYLYTFHNHMISNDPAAWGQFGDYIGGALNPITAIINLILFAYLSVNLIKVEEDRNKWTLKELVRPYFEIYYENNLSEITIVLSNCGLGPGIITKLKINDLKGNEFNSFEGIIKSHMKGSRLNISTQNINVSNGSGAIGKDKEHNIMYTKLSSDIIEDINEFKKLKTELSGCRIHIEYTDMYGTEMPAINDAVHFKIN